MLSLRLQRIGRKHDPSYRIVATDSRRGPKSNKHVAILGHHDAVRKTTSIKDAEEVHKYLAYGAKVTDTLYNILVQQGIITGAKRNVLPQKSPVIDEEALSQEAEEQMAESASSEEGVLEEVDEEGAPSEEASPSSEDSAPQTEEVQEEEQEESAS